ncbi:MAG: glycosyltransferase [Verrucomicrobiales bacterium]
MRILIVEEALEDGNGHWPAYIGCLAQGFRERGDSVDVLVHYQASAEVLERVGGIAWLRRNCWRDPSSQGGWGGVRHALSHASDLRRWLQDHPGYDWILCPTMRLQHLLAVAMGLPWMTSPPCRWLLLFVQGFGVYDGRQRPMRFPKSPSLWLARGCFRLLRRACSRGQVVVAAETPAMQAELQDFASVAVSLMPHPVAPPANLGERIPSSADEPSITLCCPGFARYEKGSDLLADAVALLRQEPSPLPITFILQWPHPFRLPDGAEATPPVDGADGPHIELINHGLNEKEYESLLQRSDFVILPYRASSYHNRLSRVAIEAASCGIPLIYSAGTWTEELASMSGGGTAIVDESPAAIVQAVRSAIAHRSSCSAAARSGAARVAQFHSVDAFRECLSRA